jgi:hypothetical protein
MGLGLKCLRGVTHPSLSRLAQTELCILPCGTWFECPAQYLTLVLSEGLCYSPPAPAEVSRRSLYISLKEDG